MTINPTTQANNNPFVPTAPGTTPTTTPLATNTTPAAPNPSTMDPLPGSSTVTPPPSGITDPTANATVGDAQNDALAQILEADDYDLNVMSSLRQPTYHARLFMTTEHDLAAAIGSTSSTQSPTAGASAAQNTAQTTGVAAMYGVLDSIPQITIAESGVTAGFNITNLEMEQAIGPGFQNRNAMMQNMKITITEPLGASLMEAIADSSIALGISNFNKMWYYIEITFRAYNDDGSINTTPLQSMNLPNGGRWVYQVMFTDVAMAMSEGGAVHTIGCVMHNISGFDSVGAGATPDTVAVSGSTIKEYLDTFGKNLTNTWTTRYLGEIFKFNFVVHDIDGGGPNPGTFKLTKSDFDPVRNDALDAVPTITSTSIPPQTSIIDVITFIYTYCEDAQKMILDTNSPSDLEDTSSAADDNASTSTPTGTYNGKKYRVPVIPVIECDVKVTGYDPITGQYTKEFTYHIWSYRSYSTNLSVTQLTNIRNEPAVAVAIAKELKAKKYLRKRYEYQFTGLNTEVTKLDMDYNFNFCNILPKITGWRGDFLAASDHAKRNPALADNASMSAQPNETRAKATATGSGTGAIQNTQTLPPPAQVGSKLGSINQQIDDLNKVDVSPTARSLQNPGQPMTDSERQAIATQISTLQAQRDALKTTASTERAQYNQQQQQARDQIEKTLPPNSYAEDALSDVSPIFNATYIQAHSTIQDGVGTTGQWHRGASLVGALMNQLYEPYISKLCKIELEIRGDPFWLGYSSIERQAIMTGQLPTNTGNPVMPNFTSGDNTIALIFRFPSGIDGNGVPIIRRDDIFNGLYRVNVVKSSFSDGTFKQTLTCTKLDLIAPAYKKIPATTGAPTTTNTNNGTNNTPLGGS